MKFVLNTPVAIEESLTCEFKEVKAKATQAIGKSADEHIVAFLNTAGGSIYWGIRDQDRVVTGVPTSPKLRDELRQVVGQKIASIAPSVAPALVSLPFHEIYGPAGDRIDDICVVEIRVEQPKNSSLFLTGSGEAYRRTLGGTKKLTGAEIFLEIAKPLQEKMPNAADHSQLHELPSVLRRATLVQPLVRGRRILWVDDNPEYTFYERVALSEMGLRVDVAMNTREALHAVKHLLPDVIVSDIEREGQRGAGLEMLSALRALPCDIPVIFYIGKVDSDRGTPRGAFDITDRPDEVLHSILDVLERTPR